MKLFIALIPLLTSSPVADESDELGCGVNEQFRECVYCSEEHCTEPMICARSCEQGDHCCLEENVCHCKSGYKRNDNGDCVEECQPTCDGKHEFWTECGSSCQEQFCPCPVGVECDLPVCPEMCEARCQCNEGYHRDDSGDCVLCESNECGLNEQWNECGSACGDAMCDGSEPEFCTEQCMARCECLPGFKRDNSGFCVENCSDSCDPNQVWNECGSACPYTCGLNQQPDFCTEECVPQCECTGDQILDGKGGCVDPSDCPRPVECGAGEHFTTCGSACNEPKCIHLEGAVGMCMTVCEERCECNEGLYRNDNGECVSAEECQSSIECPAGEHYTACGSACKEPKCHQEEGLMCATVCEQRCECDEGLVRDEYTGSCVSSNECQAECGSNEVWSDCMTCSEPSCYEQAAMCIDCMPDTECCMGKRCVCKDGLYRNDKGRCVELDSCNNRPKCEENEEWTECGNACREGACCPVGILKCSMPFCTEECMPMCRCKVGHYRGMDGSCKPNEMCGQEAVTTTEAPVVETTVAETTTAAETTTPPPDWETICAQPEESLADNLNFDKGGWGVSRIMFTGQGSALIRVNVAGKTATAPYSGSAFFARKYCGNDFLSKFEDGTIQFDILDEVISYNSQYGFYKDDSKNSAYVIQWGQMATAGNLGNQNRDQLYIQLTGLDSVVWGNKNMQECLADNLVIASMDHTTDDKTPCLAWQRTVGN